MLIIYQPYYKFASTLRYIYSEKPKVYGKLIPSKVRDKVILDLHNNGVDLDYYVCTSLQSYKDLKSTFERFKNLALRSKLFNFLKTELESYYGVENVDYSFHKGTGFSFCVYFHKLVIDTEYNLKHEIRDSFFIIECSFYYDSYQDKIYGERISNLRLHRSTFFEHEKMKSKDGYLVHPHMSTGTYSVLLRKDNPVYNNMCTGGVENLASEIKTYTYETNTELKFASFVYHIKDLLQWENNGNPYYHLKTLYNKDSSTIENLNLFDLCSVLEDHSLVFEKISELESYFNSDDKYHHQFIEIFERYFGQHTNLISVGEFINYYVLKIKYHVYSDFTIDSIEVDDIISHILHLFNFFKEVRSLYDEIDGRVLYEEEGYIWDVLRSKRWQYFYTFLCSSKNLNIKVSEYEVLPDTQIDENNLDEEIVTIDFNTTIIVFKNKPVYLKKIKNVNDPTQLRLSKQDFVLQVNPILVNTIISHTHANLTRLAKQAAENTLFKEQEKIQTFIRRRVYETSSGLSSS